MTLRELKSSHSNMISACNNIYASTLLMSNIRNITKNNVILLQTSYGFFKNSYENCLVKINHVYKGKNNTLPKMLNEYYKTVYQLQLTVNNMIMATNSILSMLHQAYTLILMATTSTMKTYVALYLQTFIVQCNAYIKQIKSYSKNLLTYCSNTNKYYNEVIN